MSIPESDIVVGGIYATASNQERRVTAIDNGRVRYDARKGSAQAEWGRGSLRANPPRLATFANACARTVSKP
jgi:hypothetical protein